MRVDTAVWLYPIDLIDAGVDTVLDEVRGLGVGGVSLAATYHAGRLLLPHNPTRAVHFLEDGVAYFWSDRARYRGPLAPKTAEAVRDRDVFGEVRASAAARRLRVSAWTIGTHNSRLGRSHPECTIRNAFGDRYSYALCPANPSVRAYLVALCAEAADVCQPAALELEAFGFMGYAHRSHHDKIAFRLDRAHEFLLSLCTCTACEARYRTHDIDPERVGGIARQALSRYFDNGGPPNADSPAAVHEFLTNLFGATSLQGLERARQDVVSSLVGDVRAAVPPSVALRMMAAPSPHVTGAAAGLELSAITPYLDAVIVDLFSSSLDEMRRLLGTARASGGKKSRLFANVRAHWPDSESGDEFVAKIDGLLQDGIEGLRFYHYGLIPRANLDWIKRAMERVDAADQA